VSRLSLPPRRGSCSQMGFGSTCFGRAKVSRNSQIRETTLKPTARATPLAMTKYSIRTSSAPTPGRAPGVASPTRLHPRSTRRAAGVTTMIATELRSGRRVLVGVGGAKCVDQMNDVGSDCAKTACREAEERGDFVGIE
jgi:hypothetical protein